MTIYNGAADNRGLLNLDGSFSLLQKGVNVFKDTFGSDNQAIFRVNMMAEA